MGFSLVQKQAFVTKENTTIREYAFDHQQTSAAVGAATLQSFTVGSIPVPAGQTWRMKSVNSTITLTNQPQTSFVFLEHYIDFYSSNALPINNSPQDISDIHGGSSFNFLWVIPTASFPNGSGVPTDHPYTARYSSQQSMNGAFMNHFFKGIISPQVFFNLPAVVVGDVLRVFICVLFEVERGRAI